MLAATCPLELIRNVEDERQKEKVGAKYSGDHESAAEVLKFCEARRRPDELVQRAGQAKLFKLSFGCHPLTVVW